MNLQNLIEQTVEAFGFSEGEKKEIVGDLINLIITKFILEVSKSGEDTAGLARALESKNQQGIIEAFSNLTKNSKNHQALEKICVETISSWVDSILPSLDSEKQQKTIDILEKLKQ